MMNSFNTFPQDNSELSDRVVVITNSTITNPTGINSTTANCVEPTVYPEPATIKNAISMAHALLEEAKEEARVQASDIASGIIEAAKLQALREIETAKQRGFQEGVALALKNFSEFLGKKEKILKDAQEQAFDLALKAAKQITGEIIQQNYQQIIADRVRQALSLFALQDTVKIKLNDIDYKMLLEQINTFALEHEQIINWQPTNSMPACAFEISVDDCKLESSIEKQLDCIITERLSIDD